MSLEPTPNQSIVDAQPGGSQYDQYISGKHHAITQSGRLLLRVALRLSTISIKTYLLTGWILIRSYGLSSSLQHFR